MSKFLKWVFDDDTPGWIVSVVVMTGIALFVMWIVLLSAAFAYQSAFLLLIWAAPAVYAWWSIWKEYRESKDD